MSLPQTLSLPSTPSLTQISQTTFPSNFSTKLDACYRKKSSNNIHLRLDWNTFVAPPPLFGQDHESNRLHNWALNRLQYRQDIHKDIKEHDIQILTQDNLLLKIEINVRLNTIIHHPLSLAPPNITAQLAFKYTKPLYKTQYSGSLVEYKQGFDMNTGKLFIQSMATHHSTSDKKFIHPSKPPKDTGNIGEKISPQDTASTR